MFWPPRSSPETFQARRDHLGKRLSSPALLVSGLSRPRNFAGNRYAFRAESHFLYFAGESLEGAA
jgi:Xaa-Pro aminopeptidase